MTDVGGVWAETGDRLIWNLLRLRPETASWLGEHSYDDRLNDLSDAGLREYRAFLGAAWRTLEELAVDGLSVSDSVDYDILRNGLARDIFALDEVAETTWNPLVWLPADGLYDLIARESTPRADRLRALAGRLGQVPDRLAAAERALGRMPKVHVQTALLQVAGNLTMVTDEISELLAAEPGLRGLVEPAQAAAERALLRYRDWLADRVDTADGDPRLGPDRFARELPLVLDSALPADTVQARARVWLDEVTEQLRELAGGDDDAVRAALDEVALDVPDDDSIVPMARRTLAEATAAVRELGLVEVPEQDVEVVVMPEARRGRSVAYCDSSGPLEPDGVTFYAVSPTPADWSAERVASFYREYNAAMVVNLTVHEAMPGHALQLAHAGRWRGSTLARHVFRSGTFIEGWASHAERLMAEAGHGGRPVRLQQLKMQLRCAINALLDVGVHAEGMSQAAAMELMTGRGFQEEGESAGKWRRALLSSSQLSTYFVGYTELLPILAGRTNYDAVLAHGNPAPRHLARLLADG